MEGKIKGGIQEFSQWRNVSEKGLGIGSFLRAAKNEEPFLEGPVVS